MSGKTSISSEASRELWQIEFENECVNDEKWSCIVTAFMETKVEDEEYLRILGQCVADDKVPLIQIIAQSDLIELLKNYEKPVKNKKRTGLEEGNKSEEKIENEGRNPRFPQVLSLVSDYAKFSEGQCKIPPELMAYALKYIILERKDKNYYKKRLVNCFKRKEREEKIKGEIIRNMNVIPYEKYSEEGEKIGLDKIWTRKKFDILEGSPSRDGPYNGPDIYIVLSGFYDPLYFVHLLKFNVPFVAVIKMENCEPIMRNIPGGSSAKKIELINYFWTEFDKGVTGGKTTALYKDIALLKFTPSFSSDHSIEDKTAISVNGIAAILYTAYNLYRLHKTFIQNMEVQRMIESLEPLELSRCKIYNRLCDALVEDNSNAEIFVLFSMIEQVVIGIPPTRERILDYKRPSSEFFLAGPEKEETVRSSGRGPEVTREEPASGFGVSNVISKERRNAKNPNIYLYGDNISLSIGNIDRNILKIEDLFDRFVINSVLLKIKSKYPVLTKAEKTESDFQFFRMWEKSKEKPDNFKIQLLFSIVMRIIERTQNLGGSSRDSSDRILGSFGSSTSELRNENNSSSTSLPEEKVTTANLFQQVDNLFYKESGAPARIFEKSTKATLELRKGRGAVTGLTAVKTISYEDLNILCGHCSRIEENRSMRKREGDDGIHLERLLEPYEISNLNEPNLLVNRKDFYDFVRKHNFYEVLEPNRMVQRLGCLFDDYNTAEWTYFSPTDTLFVLGYNDADFRGVHQSRDCGFIASPVCLRDFCTYIIPRNKKWLKRENSEFIDFLVKLAENAEAEKEKMENRLKCEFLKNYCSADEEERKNLLKYEGSRSGGGGGGGCDARDNNNNNKNSTGNRNDEETGGEPDDLPIKGKRPRPKRLCFKGINLEDVLTLVSVLNSEFHSKDGCVVRARTLSWLYAGTLLTLVVERAASKLYLNRLAEERAITESLHFRDNSGVLFTFDTQSPIPLLSKITWPNGLIIQPLPLNGTASIYIKQEYFECYRHKRDLLNESFRCYLPNGQVLIFKEDGRVCIFCPSGTRYGCKLRRADENLNPAASKKDEKIRIEMESVVNPGGEIRSPNEGANPAKKMKSFTGFDAFTGETFYRSEDGTFATLWPDGKLVTSYPDGTKITSWPETEKYEIFPGENPEAEPESEKQRGNPGGEPFETDESEGFTLVTCSYLLEHPKYATVFFKNSVTEIRKNGKANVIFSPSANYIIKCRNSVLKASSEGAHFYNFCDRCSKKSCSIVRLHSSNKNIMCDTRDFYNKRFLVYGSGQIFYKSEKDDGEVPEDGEEAPEHSGKSVSADSMPGYCRHAAHRGPRHMSLILERDLTATEFIEENLLYRYIGNLSEDAYYDLFRISEDGNTLHHGFFQPMHLPLPDGAVTEYEKSDAYPTRMSSRKEIKESGSSDSHKRNVTTRDYPIKKKERAKATVARFVRVLPSDPVQILRKISTAISLCQQRASQVGTHYRKCSKSKSQTPFRNYVSEKLGLIATSLNLHKPLRLYSHTRIALPYTESQIHSALHNRQLNNYFGQIGPDDLRPNILPRCRQISKPFKHHGRDKDIPEDEESYPTF